MNENCLSSPTENDPNATEKLSRIYDRLEELNKCAENIRTKIVGPIPSEEKNGVPNIDGIEDYLNVIKNKLEKITSTLFFIETRL